MAVIGGKKHVIIYFIVTMCIVTCCDPTFDVYIDGETKKTFSFECGAVNFLSKSAGKREFFIVQDFEINKEVIINKDSVVIIYKEDTISSKFLMENKEVQTSSLTMNNDFNLILSFYIPGGIEYGDTITIKPKGYLYCNNERINIKPIHLYFKE